MVVHQYMQELLHQLSIVLAGVALFSVPSGLCVFDESGENRFAGAGKSCRRGHRLTS
jgi:hypothetical protein